MHITVSRVHVESRARKFLYVAWCTSVSLLGTDTHGNTVFCVYFVSVRFERIWNSLDIVQPAFQT